MGYGHPRKRRGERERGSTTLLIHIALGSGDATRWDRYPEIGAPSRGSQVLKREVVPAIARASPPRWGR